MAYQNSTKNATLLISMDPAHNLCDIFDMKLGSNPTKLMNNLYGIEIDPDQIRKKYLKSLQHALQHNYAYQKAYFPDNYFSILEDSPNADELAMLMVYKDIAARYQADFHLFFDMPPTALSLRFFSLPVISLKWLVHLIKLRQRIKDKKEIISQIKWGKKEIEADRVMEKLLNLQTDYNQLAKLFSQFDIQINLVCNTDKLSVNESVRLHEKLQKIGVKPSGLFINKAFANTQPPESLKHLKNIWTVPDNKESIDSLSKIIALQNQLQKIK